MAFCPGTPKWESWIPKSQQLGLPQLWERITSCVDLQSRWGLKQSYSPHRELSNDVLHFVARTRVRSIPDFWWSGVKLPIWLLTFLFVITFVVDVQMAHASPFSTSILRQLSNGMKNVSMQGVLTPAIELWNFGSLDGLTSPHFGSEGVILSFFQSRVATLVVWFPTTKSRELT
jgi:hypothetical protein